MRRKHTAEQLEAHQREVDRLIFLAVQRREAERALREYGESPIAKILPEVKASLGRGIR